MTKFYRKLQKLIKTVALRLEPYIQEIKNYFKQEKIYFEKTNAYIGRVTKKVKFSIKKLNEKLKIYWAKLIEKISFYQKVLKNKIETYNELKQERLSRWSTILEEKMSLYSDIMKEKMGIYVQIFNRKTKKYRRLFVEKINICVDFLTQETIPTLEKTTVGVVKVIKQQLISMKKGLEAFGALYPNTAQVIQLSFIYSFAIVDLVYVILNNVLMMGYRSEVFQSFMPIIKSIIENDLLAFWASPEKVFLLSYVAIELMVIRSIFKFSKLVRYHILLVFALLMLQGLILSTLEFGFNREIVANMGRWTLDAGTFFSSSRQTGTIVFFFTFIFFFILYVYLYISALNGEFVSLKGWEWISDSVSFWLKMYTPTMKFGQDENKNKGEKEPEDPDDSPYRGGEDETY